MEAECTSHSHCGENALCQYSRDANKYKCKCDDGFEGDGQLCTSSSELASGEVWFSRYCVVAGLFHLRGIGVVKIKHTE